MEEQGLGLLGSGLSCVVEYPEENVGDEGVVIVGYGRTGLRPSRERPVLGCCISGVAQYEPCGMKNRYV